MNLLNKVPFSPFIYTESADKVDILAHAVNPEYKDFLPCCYLFAMANTFNSKALFKVVVRKELLNVVSPYYENKYLAIARQHDLSKIPDVHICDYYVDNSDVYNADFDMVKVMNIFQSEPPTGENICFLVSLLERKGDEVSMHRILIVKNSNKEIFLVDSSLPKVLLMNEKELLGIFLQYTAVNCISTYVNNKTGEPCLFKDKDLRHITSKIIH